MKKSKLNVIKKECRVGNKKDYTCIQEICQVFLSPINTLFLKKMIEEYDKKWETARKLRNLIIGKKINLFMQTGSLFP